MRFFNTKKNNTGATNRIKCVNIPGTRKSCNNNNGLKEPVPPLTATAEVTM
jgi:hypothetical protein